MPALRRVGSRRSRYARAAQTVDEPELRRVIDDHEGDWDRGGRRLGGQCRRRASRGDNAHPHANEVIRHLRQPSMLTLRPAIFDRDIVALDVAALPSTPHDMPTRTAGMGRVSRC
jgi:hypothetical protein